jgi:hypothetical protein
MVMMAIERIGATLTAQTGMVGPLSTIALGVLLLGEPLNRLDRRRHAAGAGGRVAAGARALKTSASRRGDTRHGSGHSQASGRWCAPPARAWARAAPRRWRAKA